MAICIVCGYESGTFETYLSGFASHDFCPSCGFEFGFDDLNSEVTYVQARHDWIINGRTWHPDKIDVESWPALVRKQLDNIRRVDLDSYSNWAIRIQTKWPPYSDEKEIEDSLQKFSANESKI